MIIEFLTSKFFFLLYCAIGLLVFVRTVILANKSIGIISFKEQILDEISKDPQALSDYFGKRYIALAIFCGCLAIAGSIV